MDQEQQKQLILQQLMRQQQVGHPLMHQQMMGGGFGNAGAQFFGQAPGQPSAQSAGNALNPQGQHGQHTQQPGAGGALGGGFTQALGGAAGGQMNPLFHQQNPQAVSAASMFQQHQGALSGSGINPQQNAATATNQGQTGGAHHQMQNPASQLGVARPPQGPGSLISSGQIGGGVGSQLLGQSQGGILGQIGVHAQNPGAQTSAGQTSLLGGMFIPSMQQQNQGPFGGGQQNSGGNHGGPSGAGGIAQLQQQFQQQQSQQQPGIAALGGAGAGITGQNQIAQYLKQFQEMQQLQQQQQQQNQQQTQSQTPDATKAQQVPGAQGLPGQPGAHSAFNFNQGANQQTQSASLQQQLDNQANALAQQQQTTTQATAGNTGAPTNVHTLNFLGHLGQPGAQQQANLQANAGGLSTQQLQQLMAQGGLPGQIGNASLAQQLSQQQAANALQQQKLQQTPQMNAQGLMGINAQKPTPMMGQPGSVASGLQQLGGNQVQGQNQFGQQQQNPSLSGAQGTGAIQGMNQPGLQLGQLQNPGQSSLQQQFLQNQLNQQQTQRPQALHQTTSQPNQPNATTNQHMVGTGIAGSVLAAETGVSNLQNQGAASNAGAPGPSAPTLPQPSSLGGIGGQGGATGANVPAGGNNMMNVSNLNKLAEYCATNGEYHHAIEYYLQLTNIDPDNGPAWTALGHCYLLVEDLQKSFNAYQHALYSLEDIKDPQLWYGIGILYEKFESYDHAISALIAVLKMSPNFYQKSEVLYKLGIIFAKTNQIEQAISYFQNSILTNTFTVKRKVDTLLKIGLLYEEARDYGQAQRSYEAALTHDENNFKIYQHLAWSFFLQGNINTAIEYVRKAEKKNKAQSDSFYILGRCFMALENNKDALENFQQAAYKNPGEAVYWATLAIFYYNTGNYTDAFENIIKATTLNPQMSEVWYNLGVLYEKCRQPEEALIAYSKVLELDSEDADAQKRIMAIKSPFYQHDQQQNKNPSQLSLQMKYPKFTLPNSLMILRKFKKQQPGAANTTGASGQTGNRPEGSAPGAAQGGAPGSLQLNPSQQQALNLAGAGNTQLGGASGNQNQLPTNFGGLLGGAGNANLQRLLGNTEDNNNVATAAGNGNQIPSLMAGLNAQANKNLPQQQFQGRQEDGQPQQHQFNFNTTQQQQNNQSLQMKLQGGGGLGTLGTLNPSNPENYVNKLSDIHQILKSNAPTQVGSNAQNAAPNIGLLQQPQNLASTNTSNNAQAASGSNNFGQGASSNDNQINGGGFNAQQTNQGIQQMTQLQQPSQQPQLFNQNQQVTQGQNIQVPTTSNGPQGGGLNPSQNFENRNPFNTQNQLGVGQGGFSQIQGNSDGQSQQPCVNTEALASQQPVVNLQKTNLNQIMQSLPSDINFLNLTREQLIMILQQQQQQTTPIPQHNTNSGFQPPHEDGQTTKKEEEAHHLSNAAASAAVEQKPQDLDQAQNQQQQQPLFSGVAPTGMQGNNGMQFAPPHFFQQPQPSSGDAQAQAVVAFQAALQQQQQQLADFAQAQQNQQSNNFGKTETEKVDEAPAQGSNPINQEGASGEQRPQQEGSDNAKQVNSEIAPSDAQ